MVMFIRKFTSHCWLLSWPQLWCCVFSPLFRPHPLVVNYSHLVRISSSTPLQIHLVSLRSSPDRTTRLRGSYSYLAPVYTLSLVVLLLIFHASPFFLFVYSLWTYTSMHPTLPPAPCLIPDTSNKPVHLHSTPVLPLCSALGSSSYRSP